MYSIINNVFLTTQKDVGHDCQVWGDFASDVLIFMLDFVWRLALISSPDILSYLNGYMEYFCSCKKKLSLTSQEHVNPMENTLTLHIWTITYFAEYTPHRLCKNKKLCYGHNCCG